VLAGMESNFKAVIEARYDFVIWMGLIFTESICMRFSEYKSMTKGEQKARLLEISPKLGLFVQPEFLSCIFGKLLISKKYLRSDKDLFNCVNLWCDNPAKATKKYGHISSWDTTMVTSMENLFNGNIYANGQINRSDFNDDISNWDVSSVTNMCSMFWGARSFNCDISQWNISNVTNMNHMFHSAESFNQDLSKWCVPTSVLGADQTSHMFDYCSIDIAKKPLQLGIWTTFGCS
jgi:hypothetical protein